LQTQKLVADFLLKTRLQRRLDDPLTNFSAGFSQGLDVVDIQRFQAFCNTLRQVIGREEIAECQCRGGTAARYPNSRVGELADEFSERCVFTADHFNIGHSQLLEWHDVRAIMCCLGHKKS